MFVQSVFDGCLSLWFLVCSSRQWPLTSDVHQGRLLSGRKVNIAFFFFFFSFFFLSFVIFSSYGIEWVGGRSTFLFSFFCNFFIFSSFYNHIEWAEGQISFFFLSFSKFLFLSLLGYIDMILFVLSRAICVFFHLSCHLSLKEKCVTLYDIWCIYSKHIFDGLNIGHVCLGKLLCEYFDCLVLHCILSSGSINKYSMINKMGKHSWVNLALMIL